MTLKKKILIGYGVAFALMGLVVAWAVTNLVSLGQASGAILSENYRSILAAENMVDALERQDSAILLILLGEKEKGTGQYRENEAVFLEWLARAKDNITIAGEAERINSIERDFAAYRRQFSALIDLRDADGTLPRASAYQQTVYPLFARVRDACINLRKLNEETMYAASVEAGSVASRAIWSTTAVAAAASLVALIFSLFLAERIVRPVRRFMEASRQISSGDYAVQVPVETGDELGRLAVEFNQMATRLGRYHEMNIEQIIAEKTKGEAILASIEDPLVVFDPGLKITAVNPAAHRMLDLPLSETSALRCADIIPDAAVCDLIRHMVETGVHPAVPDEQRIIVFPDGERRRHYLFSVTAIRGKDRNLTGIVLLLRDVTRLKEVEQLKSEFIMAASHELRTPLTSLGMSVDLLLEHAVQALPEKDRVLLRAAHEEVHRMKALVNDLLDLSRIEAGRIEMEFENLQVQVLFDHVLTIFKSQADMKGVELTAEAAGDLPVRADANKITWVLTNLISNALRYVGREGHVRLLARRIGPLVHLSVSDDGPGIPLEYQSRIFQKFVQIKGQETDGSGLGLAICKEIVRAHGGAIWVESSPGRGSAFTFTLPVGG
ncbi:MAG: cell wall metabolism sensor histidine kinase WalK [Proteobacteria bacterium]|nr:cell wall metabolism sensor histidine kinase WalK [Pseudomonadota bacterium]MBU4297952.1 cell wall metabolism sensor histidine kinase WalK [Pseudomonadota bacterium]MCG2749201.1 cell wall metabolism sensor histidine kinase WalK [Desulfobulbaceae bacterium]